MGIPDRARSRYPGVMPDDLRVLFCADPLRPGRADEHFAAQAATVRELGGHVALVDHDALMAGDADRAVRGVPRTSGPWWYRGWMMPAAAYDGLAAALQRRESALRVPPARYRLAHELPGWYGTFADVTADSDWMPWPPQVRPSPEDIAPLVRTLGSGAAVAKDYVKSRKHEWLTACFIPDVTDLEHATSVVARMVELQDDSLNGGIVLRRYEDYRQADGRTVEARVWWVDGEPVMVTAHPDTPDLHAEPELVLIRPLVQALGCPFVTTDLAQRSDGVWRVVEVGDGQVSDLPVDAHTTPLFERLGQPVSIDLPPACPTCSAAAVPILYGLPVSEAVDAAERGLLVLGGCIVADDSPQWRCPAGHEWSTSDARRTAAIAAVLADNSRTDKP